MRLLAYVTGTVNQELLLQNEYLATENRILRAKLPSRLRLSDPERATLAEIGKRLGRKALREVARVAKPDTILAWYRRLVAEKFDGSQHRQCPGRARIQPEVEALVVRMARENSGTTSSEYWPTWVTDYPTRRSEIFCAATALVRQQSLYRCSHECAGWRRLLHRGGPDLAGLVTYYVLFFLHLESRRVSVAGITRHPDQEWME